MWAFFSKQKKTTATAQFCVNNTTFHTTGTFNLNIFRPSFIALKQIL